jgi:hypothetical protein
MSGLRSEHETFQQWHTETKMILEKAFNSKSVHYQNFLALRFREMSVKAFSSPEIDRINAARYKKDLDHARSILQSAIKELTLDRTLFKKIQTTPQTVEVSLKGDIYISSGILEPEVLQAIKHAFEGSGLTPINGSEAIQRGEPLSYRIEQIRHARFGIYDVSSPDRSDVLLELGAALGMVRETVIIYRKNTPLSGTMGQLRGIEYDTPSDLTEKLKKKIA